MSSRKERRDRTEVRIWMLRKKLKGVDIQKALNLKYYTQVVETLQGDRDDRKVLKWLEDNGCPTEFLHLPIDMTDMKGNAK